MLKQTKTTDSTYSFTSRYRVLIYVYSQLTIVGQRSACSECSAVIEFKTYTQIRDINVL